MNNKNPLRVTARDFFVGRVCNGRIGSRRCEVVTLEIARLLWGDFPDVPRNLPEGASGQSGTPVPTIEKRCKSVGAIHESPADNKK